MKHPGQIALTPFPYSDLTGSKLRPVLLLRRVSSRYEDDWLVCMVSSRLHQMEGDLDEMVNEDAPDFPGCGLKAPSVLRVSRLAVLEASLFVGSIGAISPERLSGIKSRLAKWIEE